MYNYVIFGFSPEIAVLAGNLKCNFVPLTVENVHNSVHLEHVTVVNFFSHDEQSLWSMFRSLQTTWKGCLLIIQQLSIVLNHLNWFSPHDS